MTATLTPTVSKQAANYRVADDPARSCGTCIMFVAASNACTLVRGAISAEDTCDRWEARDVAKYSPDQFRDDHGRWAPGGGGAAPSATPPNAPRIPAAKRAYFAQLALAGENEPSLTPYDTPEVRGARKLNALLPQTVNTTSPQRDALRQRIADDLYGHGARLKQREAWLLLGSPGAGKSTLAQPLGTAHGALVIDSDQAKMRLPEFGSGTYAPTVHAESSDLTDHRVLARAVAAGDNVVVQTVGRTPAYTLATATAFQDAGYQVHAVLVDAPPAVAAQRAVSRFYETGRFVDPAYVLNDVGTKPRGTYEALKAHPGVVSYVAYSTAVPRGAAPRLLERGRPHAGGAGGRGVRAQLAAWHRGGRTPPQVVELRPEPVPILKAQGVLPLTDFKSIGRGHIRALIVDAGGRLLLLHWDKGRFRPSDWAPVQGRIGDEPNPPDETPLEAARREVEEETGYAGDALTWRTLYPNCWLVQLPPGAGSPKLSAEHNAYRWLPAPEAQTWLAREQFYGEWTRSLGRRGRVRKQLDAHHPHIAAALVHGAQLGDWGPLAELLVEALGEAGSEATVQAVDALGVDDPGAFRVANRFAVDWAAQRAAALVRGIQARTEAGLRELVATALGEGWSTDELSQAIQDDWLFSPARAELIAQTELAMAHSQGTLAAWKATGQVAGKRNILSNLHAIDDECDDATAVGVIPITDSFPDGSDAPPFHPRCRCALVPELMDQSEEGA